MPNANDELTDFGRQLAAGESPAIQPGGALAHPEKDKDKHDKDKHDKDKHHKDHDHRHPPHGRSHATIAA